MKKAICIISICLLLFIMYACSGDVYKRQELSIIDDFSGKSKTIQNSARALCKSFDELLERQKKLSERKLTLNAVSYTHLDVYKRQSYGCCPFPMDCAGNPWTAAYVGTTGDPIADITNDMAAEEKARAGYEGVMQFTKDENIYNALVFLREREVVHFQRFGEALNILNAAKDKGLF